MPTYEYSCKACGEHLEIVQSFKDESLTTCPACGGPLRKVFGNIGIAFKGSGFYKNDSRPAPKDGSGDTGTKKESGTKKEASASSSGSGSAKEASGASSGGSTAVAS